MGSGALTKVPQVSSTGRNLLANYAGKIWSGLCAVLFIPLYVKLLGIEAFGLIGFYGILLGVLALLDLGFNATITRELAQSASDERQGQRLNDLLITVQSFYWISAGLTAVFVALSAGWLARNWLNAGALPLATVEQAIMLMGLTVSGQMLLGFYSAGLLGLQRHVACNIVNALIATLRFAGAVAILYLLSPSINAFFIWQVIATFVGVLVVARLVWRHMPVGRPVFKPALLRDVWRFTFGIFLTSMLLMLIYQTDKIVMSKMLSLQEFGYYAFAVAVVGFLQNLANPVFVTFFPAFTQKVAVEHYAELVAQYHRATQLLAVAIIPAGGVLLFLPEPLVLAWTGDALLASNTSQLISLFGLGTVLHLMTSVPYSLQLAHGWTRLAVLGNLALFVALVPTLFFAVRFNGAAGAAMAWMLLNCIHLVGSVGIMHRRLLIGEQARWYLYDLFPAAFTVLLVGIVVNQIQAFPLARVPSAILVCTTYFLFLMGAVLASREIRKLFIVQLLRLLQSFKTRLREFI